jgi:solute carrier family 25 folate transporter 32
LKGYYRGIVPALFGTSHGALQFMAYEQLKIFHGDNNDKKMVIGN